MKLSRFASLREYYVNIINLRQFEKGAEKVRTLFSILQFGFVLLEDCYIF